MEDFETDKGPAVKLYEQRTLSYNDINVLQSFIWDYGHTKVIECLETMARHAIGRGDAIQFLYADQAAYFARNLKDKEYRDACALEAKLSKKIALTINEIDNISNELREIHAKFSFFWYRIKRLIKPQNFPNGRAYRIISALQVDWGVRDKLDIELLRSIINEFLDEVLQTAAMVPENLSYHRAWRILPGGYLEFGELSDRVPEVLKEIKKSVRLIGRKEELMAKLNELQWERVYATKKASDHLSSLRKIIYAVGIDKLAAQLDKAGM
jgi:hypothetical protein